MIYNCSLTVLVEKLIKKNACSIIVKTIGNQRETLVNFISKI
jgi:hypothetical protein